MRSWFLFSIYATLVWSSSQKLHSGYGLLVLIIILFTRSRFIIVRMANRTLKSKHNDNIDFAIWIGTHPITLSVPRQTKVGGLVNIVRSFEQ